MSQVEVVSEALAARVPPGRGEDWLYEFVALIGGDMRILDEARHLVVASAEDRFVITAADTWSVAEALGHVFLHFDHIDPLEGFPPVLAVPRHLAPVGPYARAGLEAGWFAAAFLMPGLRFCRAWEAHGGSLRAVAAEFSMPMGSVANRAYRLRLA